MLLTHGEAKLRRASLMRVSNYFKSETRVLGLGNRDTQLVTLVSIYYHI
jgi:hypothetical protein